MSDDKPDTTTLTGAEFQRHAGTDAHKWAEAFYEAYSEAALMTTRGERIEFVRAWFRDYAEVCVAEEVGRVTARLVPRHTSEPERPVLDWCAQKTVAELIEEAKWAVTRWELYRRLCEALDEWDRQHKD